MITYDSTLRIFTSNLIFHVAGFTTKSVGDGRDTNVKVELMGKIAPGYKSIIIPHQTHSTDIEIVGKDDLRYPFRITERCDGLITTLKRVVLTIITADCVPIIYSDDKNGVIGISHQGWKGTLGMFPEKMVNQMVKYGARTNDIHCVIGPSINDCCYEVFGERLEKFTETFGEEVTHQSDNKTYLNLIKANYLTLLKAGIKKENIDFFPFCTSCDATKFYSNYRDRGIKGEMISFVMVK